MNPFQIEVKLGVIQQQAKLFVEQLKAAEQEILREDGAGQAARTLAERIEALHKDLENTRDTVFADMLPEDQVKCAEVCKRYLSRAVALASTMATTTDMSKVRAVGKVSALQNVVDTLQKQYEQERSALQEFRDALERGDIAIEDGEPVQRSGRQSTGLHPGASLAAQRKQEEVASSANPPEKPKGKAKAVPKAKKKGD